MGREPRAVDLLVERLTSNDGEASDSVREACRGLDAKVVRERVELFRGIAGNLALPLMTRAAAANALVKVDPRAAVDSVTAGFATLDEQTRRQIVSLVRNDLPSGEAKDFLDSVAANDPAKNVRREAAAPRRP